MDPKPYKSVHDLYKFLLEKQAILDAVDISYMTGVLKTLVDLYYEPDNDPQPEPSSMRDIFRKKFL